MSGQYSYKPTPGESGQAASSDPGPEIAFQLRIGSFCLNDFRGQTEKRDADVTRVLSEILRRFDLLLLMEAKTEGCATHIDLLIRHLYTVDRNDPFDFEENEGICPVHGHEHYCFFYRTSRLGVLRTVPPKEDAAVPMTELKTTGQQEVSPRNQSIPEKNKDGLSEKSTVNIEISEEPSVKLREENEDGGTPSCRALSDLSSGSEAEVIVKISEVSRDTASSVNNSSQNNDEGLEAKALDDNENHSGPAENGQASLSEDKADEQEVVEDGSTPPHDTGSDSQLPETSSKVTPQSNLQKINVSPKNGAWHKTNTAGEESDSEEEESNSTKLPASVRDHEILREQERNHSSTLVVVIRKNLARGRSRAASRDKFGDIFDVSDLLPTREQEKVPDKSLVRSSSRVYFGQESVYSFLSQEDMPSTSAELQGSKTKENRSKSLDSDTIGGQLKKTGFIHVKNSRPTGAVPFSPTGNVSTEETQSERRRSILKSSAVLSSETETQSPRETMQASRQEKETQSPRQREKNLPTVPAIKQPPRQDDETEAASQEEEGRLPRLKSRAEQEGPAAQRVQDPPRLVVSEVSPGAPAGTETASLVQSHVTGQESVAQVCRVESPSGEKLAATRPLSQEGESCRTILSAFLRPPFAVWFSTSYKVIPEFSAVALHTSALASDIESEQLQQVYEYIRNEWNCQNVLFMGDLHAERTPDGCWRMLRHKTDQPVQSERESKSERTILAGMSLINSFVSGSDCIFMYDIELNLPEEKCRGIMSERFPVKILLGGPCKSAVAPCLRVGSFCINDFRGQTEQQNGDVTALLSEILRGFDLLLIMEAKTDGRPTYIDSLIRQLHMVDRNDPFDFEENEGMCPFHGLEHYCFFYRARRLCAEGTLSPKEDEMTLKTDLEGTVRRKTEEEATQGASKKEFSNNNMEVANVCKTVAAQTSEKQAGTENSKDKMTKVCQTAFVLTADIPADETKTETTKAFQTVAIETTGKQAEAHGNNVRVWKVCHTVGVQTTGEETAAYETKAKVRDVYKTVGVQTTEEQEVADDSKSKVMTECEVVGVQTSEEQVTADESKATVTKLCKTVSVQTTGEQEELDNNKSEVVNVGTMIGAEEEAREDETKAKVSKNCKTANAQIMNEEGGSDDNNDKATKVCKKVAFQTTQEQNASDNSKVTAMNVRKKVGAQTMEKQESPEASKGDEMKVLTTAALQNAKEQAKASQTDSKVTQVVKTAGFQNTEKQAAAGKSKGNVMELRITAGEQNTDKLARPYDGTGLAPQTSVTQQQTINRTAIADESKSEVSLKSEAQERAAEKRSVVEKSKDTAFKSAIVRAGSRKDHSERDDSKVYSSEEYDWKEHKPQSGKVKDVAKEKSNTRYESRRQMVLGRAPASQPCSKGCQEAFKWLMSRRGQTMCTASRTRSASALFRKRASPGCKAARTRSVPGRSLEKVPCHRQDVSDCSSLRIVIPVESSKSELVSRVLGASSSFDSRGSSWTYVLARKPKLDQVVRLLDPEESQHKDPLQEKQKNEEQYTSRVTSSNDKDRDDAHSDSVQKREYEVLESKSEELKTTEGGGNILPIGGPSPWPGGGSNTGLEHGPHSAAESFTNPTQKTAGNPYSDASSSTLDAESIEERGAARLSLLAAVPTPRHVAVFRRTSWISDKSVESRQLDESYVSRAQRMLKSVYDFVSESSMTQADAGRNADNQRQQENDLEEDLKDEHQRHLSKPSQDNDKDSDDPDDEEEDDDKDDISGDVEHCGRDLSESERKGWEKRKGGTDLICESGLHFLATGSPHVWSPSTAPNSGPEDGLNVFTATGLNLLVERSDEQGTVEGSDEQGTVESSDEQGTAADSEASAGFTSLVEVGAEYSGPSMTHGSGLNSTVETCEGRETVVACESDAAFTTTVMVRMDHSGPNLEPESTWEQETVVVSKADVGINNQDEDRTETEASAQQTAATDFGGTMSPKETFYQQPKLTDFGVMELKTCNQQARSMTVFDVMELKTCNQQVQSMTDFDVMELKTCNQQAQSMDLDATHSQTSANDQIKVAQYILLRMEGTSAEAGDDALLRTKGTSAEVRDRAQLHEPASDQGSQPRNFVVIQSEGETSYEQTEPRDFGVVQSEVGVCNQQPQGTRCYGSEFDKEISYQHLYSTDFDSSPPQTSAVDQTKITGCPPVRPSAVPLESPDDIKKEIYCQPKQSMGADCIHFDMRKSNQNSQSVNVDATRFHLREFNQKSLSTDSFATKTQDEASSQQTQTTDGGITHFDRKKSTQISQSMYSVASQCEEETSYHQTRSTGPDPTHIEIETYTDVAKSTNSASAQSEKETSYQHTQSMYVDSRQSPRSTNPFASLSQVQRRSTVTYFTHLDLAASTQASKKTASVASQPEEKTSFHQTHSTEVGATNFDPEASTQKWQSTESVWKLSKENKLYQQKQLTDLDAKHFDTKASSQPSLSSDSLATRFDEETRSTGVTAAHLHMKPHQQPQSPLCVAARSKGENSYRHPDSQDSVNQGEMVCLGQEGQPSFQMENAKDKDFRQRLQGASTKPEPVERDQETNEQLLTSRETSKLGVIKTKTFDLQVFDLDAAVQECVGEDKPRAQGSEGVFQKGEERGKFSQIVFLRAPFIVQFSSTSSVVREFTAVALHVNPLQVHHERQGVRQLYDLIKKEWHSQDVLFMGDLCAERTSNDVTDSWLTLQRGAGRLPAQPNSSTSQRDNRCERIILAGERLVRSFVYDSESIFRYDVELKLTEKQLCGLMSDRYPIEIKLNGALLTSRAQGASLWASVTVEQATPVTSWGSIHKLHRAGSRLQASFHVTVLTGNGTRLVKATRTDVIDVRKCLQEFQDAFHDILQTDTINTVCSLLHTPVMTCDTAGSASPGARSCSTSAQYVVTVTLSLKTPYACRVTVDRKLT